ncbi:MAG: alpha-L-fucosidase, partial [Lentisphaeria bacterium]|nr:alpha-L-fucosidase [Lentisphaeria bacterium]
MDSANWLPTAKPTPRQREYQDWEMGLFLHFGIRTFYEGHRDWDGKPMPPEGFCPSGLNCDQWAVTARRAGMAYAVLVCKHHDGFANWPSAFSGYSVAQTPWKNGRG